MSVTETADLGGGCFWCLEAVFQDLRGVISVKSGYQGGHVPNPSYKHVCTGTTGHAEVVRVVFDPGQVSYADILRVFFTIHDPTTKDRQGNDIGPQYRSVIFAHTPEQTATAKAIMKEVSDSNIWGAPLVTELVDAPAFYPAEDEHDNYFNLNPFTGYCRVVVAPKVMKFRKQFADRLKK